jgi:chromosome segregation ATPase
MTKRIVYLDAAADILGVSPEALRKRIKRGSIDATKDEGGRWLITLPDDVQDGGGGRGQAEKDVIIKGLNSQIDELKADKEYLKERLADRDEELRQRSEELAWANMKKFQIENDNKQLENKLRLLLEAPKPRRWWPFS